jgi:uncharacterized membrane-anchored protein YhcB (DUF1043 family)
MIMKCAVICDFYFLLVGVLVGVLIQRLGQKSIQ